MKLDEVQFSWDGFTTSRIDIHGNSIEDKVYENIMYALSQGMTFDIKSVINNENVDKLLDLHYIFKQLKPYGANGEFVIAHGIDYDESFYDSLQKNLIYTFDLDKMYSMHLNKICAYLYDDEYASCDIGKYYTLDSKGILNYCTALAQENVVLNYEDTQKRCFDKECKHCEYKRICDGGCRYERYQVYGNRWKDFFIYPTCRITKIYFNTISTWLHSLSSQDENKFLSILRKYKEWQYKRFGLE